MHYPTPVLYRVVDSIFRYKWRCVTAMVIVTGTVVGLVLHRPKEYVATAATMVVNNDQMAQVMGQGNGYPMWTAPSQVNIGYFNNFLRDNAPGGFVDIALRNARLNPPIDLGKNPDDPRLDKLLKGLTTNPDSAEVFSISLKWKDERETERIVRAFQRQFIESRGESKQAESIATVAFLREQTASMEKQLRAADQAVSEFKRKFNGNMPEQQSVQLEQVSLLQSDLDTLEVSAQNNQIEQHLLKERLKQLKPKIVLEQTYQATTSTSTDRLQKKLQERDELLTRDYKPTSTLVSQLNNAITRLQEQVINEQKQAEEQARKGSPNGNIAETRVQDNPAYLDTVQRLYDSQSAERIAAARRANLQRRIAQYHVQMSALPIAEQRLNERLRRRDVLKSTYDDLMLRLYRAEVQAGQEKRVGISTLIALGVVHAESTSTGKKLLMIIIGGCVVGLFIGAGSILVSEWLDTTLRYPSDTERLLGVPVLAALPEVGALRLHIALPSADLPEEGGSNALSAA